jgi:hypothetical protein
MVPTHLVNRDQILPAPTEGHGAFENSQQSEIPSHAICIWIRPFNDRDLTAWAVGMAAELCR